MFLYSQLAEIGQLKLVDIFLMVSGYRNAIHAYWSVCGYHYWQVRNQKLDQNTYI